MKRSLTGWTFDTDIVKRMKWSKHTPYILATHLIYKNKMKEFKKIRITLEELE
jgi:hypothetical protein